LDLRGRDDRKAGEDYILRSFTSPNIIKENGMGGVCNRHRNMRNACNISVGKPEGKRPLERLKRRWEMKLEWVLRKQGQKVSTGWVWLRIGRSGGLL
jgi:hypothetical protein